MFGLSDNNINELVSVFKNFKEVEQAVIFGSRAKGNYKNGSDVDIVLKGKNLDFNINSKIRTYLNWETLMPYKFDIINYNDIKNDELIDHIERVGKVIYKKNIN